MKQQMYSVIRILPRANGFKKQFENISSSSINSVADEMDDLSSWLAITLFAISPEEITLKQTDPIKTTKP